LGFIICRVIVSSEIRQGADRHPRREARTRFLGYRVEAYKLFVFTLSPAWRASPARSTCRRSVLSNPSEFSPANSIEAVIWVAVGGRGTLTARCSRGAVNYGKTYFTSGFLAPYWLFLLGGLFIA